MEPNNIPQQITNFINQRYQLWDNAHPNQIWTDAQKNIVNHFIITHINEVNEDNEDNVLNMQEINELNDQEINELYQGLTDLLDELFQEANNDPANVGLFQEDGGLFGNNDDNNI